MNPTSNDIIVESYSTHTPKLRVALVTETFAPEVNGVAMTLGRLVGGLLQRGHEVQVVRPRQAKETKDSDAPLREGLTEVLSRGIPVPTYGELRFGLPSKNRLVKLWDEKRPDVVHVATEGPLGWSAVAASRRLHLPVTSSFHTNFHNYTQHYGIGLLKSPIDRYLRKLHNRTQATMVPTQAMLQELDARGYTNLSVLSRGVATDLFTPRKRSQALRDSWGVAANALVVLHVGRLAKEKNVGLVISAFRAIQARQPHARLVWVGDGPLRKQLEDACPQAVFTGIQKGEDLARHYASGDMFLFPSLTETYGNVVPEAMASGLAVVSFANAAAQELITTGHNGVLVHGGQELDFIAAAVQVATDSVQRRQMQAHAPASVMHLGWDAIYDSFIATLSSVVDRHGQHFSSALPAHTPGSASPFSPSSA